jgi:FAD/FMN-containing dehydrogenase
MPLNRRQVLKGAGAIVVWPPNSLAQSPGARPLLNDIHSQLNPTRVDRILAVDSHQAVQRAVGTARRENKKISIAGGRHAMGAQQFGTGTIHLDIRPMNRVLGIDSATGILEVEAGIEWPELIEQCVRMQAGAARQWGIAQKQTGADRLTIGGALAANAHGRGLRMKPFIGDVESFVLVDAEGQPRTCSRTENAELFRLVMGGYGLFGVVTSVKLRLVPRQKVERVVEILDVDRVPNAFAQRIADGYLYGDFQFAIDENSDDFLRRGVFSCYRPAGPDRPVPENQKELADSDWRTLLYLAHADKSRAFDTYSRYYLSTSGQVYWSDTHQLSIYPDHYHQPLDQRLKAAHRATEIITEIYVPRPALPDFFAAVRDDFRKNRVNLIYGTVRLIERDTESFLAWAKQSYACTIFNLHTVHTEQGIAHSAAAFRRLIDMAIRRGGSYFLTYHKYATRRQVEACYPQFPEFLRRKGKYDPQERFSSDWYRHYTRMFADVL